MPNGVLKAFSVSVWAVRVPCFVVFVDNRPSKLEKWSITV